MYAYMGSETQSHINVSLCACDNKAVSNIV